MIANIRWPMAGGVGLVAIERSTGVNCDEILHIYALFYSWNFVREVVYIQIALVSPCVFLRSHILTRRTIGLIRYMYFVVFF